jgi:hypothetical protein
MHNDPTRPGAPPGTRVDIAKDNDLRHWSRELDVTADELVRAVAQVGDDPQRIEQHLRQRRGERPSSSSERS